MEKKKRKLQYVTLIWEELPTDIKIFVIPRSELRKEDIAMLKACHRNYVGATGRFTELVSSTQSIDRSLILLHNKITNPDADWITKSYIKDQADQLHMDPDEFDDIFGSWYRFRVDSEKPKTLPRSKMYRSGYLE